jgi:hypothetical protein
MTYEATSSPELTEHERNQALLAEAEMGGVLLGAYLAATAHDPRLEAVMIVPITEPDHKQAAYAVPADVTRSGKQEVHLRLGGLDRTLDYFASVLRDFPQPFALIAERIGVEPGEMTPQLMYVHSLLHELGHAAEHLDFENNMDRLRMRNRYEREALPLGYIGLAEVMDPSSKIRQSIDRNWPMFQAELGVSTIHDLAQLQGVAYRKLSSEARADYFSAHIFKTNPELLDGLTALQYESV